MAYSAEVKERLESGRESDEWMAQVRVPPREVVVFTRQLGALIAAGMPLVRALDTLSQQAENPLFGEILWTLHDTISAGAYMSSSCQRFPRVFPPVYVRMLRVAETTGQLSGCLEQLAEWSERNLRVTEKVKAALVYPVFVLTLGIVLTLSIFLFVLPPFLGVLESMQVELPWNTRLMMFLSRLVVHPGFWVALLSGVGLLMLRWHYLSRSDASLLWKLGYRLPGVGRVLEVSSLSRFATAASALIESGCDVATTWRLSAESSGSPLLIGDSHRLVERIRAGQEIFTAMGDRPALYTSTLIQFTRAGEEGASLARMLDRLKRIFEDEVELALQSFTVLLEPLLLAVVAGVSAFSMISMFMPLYGYLNNL